MRRRRQRVTGTAATHESRALIFCGGPLHGAVERTEARIGAGAGSATASSAFACAARAAGTGGTSFATTSARHSWGGIAGSALHRLLEAG